MLLETLVERSIFHLLRKEVVARGYLPDIYQFDIENPNVNIAKQQSNLYEAALKNVKNTKGFAIEVFNYSSNQAYGDKNVPRIVVQTDAFMPGNLGLDPTRKYEKKEDGSFLVKKSVEMVSDYYFTIYLAANTTSTMRQLHDIMVSVIPRRGYIKRYDDTELRPDSNLLIQYLSTSDISYLSEGIMEKVYKYMIPDVHEVDDRIITDVTIPEIKEIGIHDENDNNPLIIT